MSLRSPCRTRTCTRLDWAHCAGSSAESGRKYGMTAAKLNFPDGLNQEPEISCNSNTVITGRVCSADGPGPGRGYRPTTSWSSWTWRPARGPVQVTPFRRHGTATSETFSVGDAIRAAHLHGHERVVVGPGIKELTANTLLLPRAGNAHGCRNDRAALYPAIVKECSAHWDW